MAFFIQNFRASCMSNLSSIIKSIQDIMRQDSGVDGDAQRLSQLTWLLFLKVFDALEEELEFTQDDYHSPIPEPLRWRNWAADAEGMTGDALLDFVDNQLIPTLGNLPGSIAQNPRGYVVRGVFEDAYNYMKSGHLLRQVVNKLNSIDFNRQAERHQFNDLYEKILKDLQSAGNAGEFYTPRPVTEFMVRMVDPKLHEKVMDPACGTGGFLTCTIEHKRKHYVKTPEDERVLQSSIFGVEKKPLPHLLATTNMILHGIEAPNIVHTNTLAENIADIQEKDRYDVILANPPFGGKERKEVQQNFPIKTGETAFLFLQHFIKSLKAGGRAAIVIKNTFLSNTDNASVSIRKLLLESCNLHTLLDCPSGTFQGAGVKTVVLFFEKGAPTRKVWYYQLDPGRNMGKTNPLNDDDLAEFVALQATLAESPKSWSVDVANIDTSSYDLSVKNPNGGEVVALRSPQEILDEIAALDAESAEVLAAIRELVA